MTYFLMTFLLNKIFRTLSCYIWPTAGTFHPLFFLSLLNALRYIYMYFPSFVGFFLFVCQCSLLKRNFVAATRKKKLPKPVQCSNKSNMSFHVHRSTSSYSWKARKARTKVIYIYNYPLNSTENISCIYILFRNIKWQT